MLKSNNENYIYEININIKDDLKLGDKISGSYSEDIDIRSMHMIIRDIFSYYHMKNDIFYRKIELLNKYIENNKDSFLKCKEYIRDKKKIEEKIDFFSIKQWNLYCNEVKNLLEEYSDLTTVLKKKKLHIGYNTNKSCFKTDEDTRLYKRLIVIRKYLRIASNYIEMDIIFYPPYQIGCKDCNLSLDKMVIDDEQGVYICNCNIFFGKVYNNETPNIDPDKIESNIKNSYDDKTNFTGRLKRYQGIQSRKISKDLLDLLDKHMQSKYLLKPAEEIRKMKLDINGHRGSPETSIGLLVESLKETHNNTNFQDINIISYDLWGWKCPSIEHLVPTILDDYVKTQEVYKRINHKFSSINVELRLYWHLRIAGHECLLEDFKIPQSRDSRKRYSEIFKIMCKEVGLVFYPII